MSATNPELNKELHLEKERKIDSLKIRLYHASTDSTRAIYLEQLAKLYNQVKPDSSISYRHQAIALCKAKGWADCWEENNHKLAIVLINRGQLQEAQERLNQVRDHALMTGNQWRYGAVLIHTAWLKNKEGKLGEALSLYLKALEVKESINDWKGLSDIYNRLGILYLEWNSPRRALANFNKAIAIGRGHEKKGMYTAALYNAAKCYQQIGELEKSKECYKEYIELRLKQKNTRSLGYIFIARARTANMNNDRNLEHQYLDSALYYFSKFQRYPEKANTLIRKANILLENGANSTAIDLANRALTISKVASNHRNMIKAHKTLADAYSQEQNYRTAYFHQEQHELLRDSFYGGAAAEQLISMENYFRERQKQQEVALIKANNDLTALQLKKNRSQQNYLFFLLLLSISLIALFIYLLRQKHKNNKYLQKTKLAAEEALEEKGFLVKEVHHRVKNNLQVISSLLRLQTKYIQDDAALKAIEEGRNRVQSMSLIHQHLYQDDHAQQIQLHKYVEQLTRSLFRSYNIEPERIQLKLNIAPTPLDTDTAINIGLIINELITNALKYAFPPEQKGEITVTLAPLQGQLELCIRDNGIGSNFISAHNGFGYQLISSICKRMNAKIDIERRRGTRICIKIPYQIRKKTEVTKEPKEGKGVLSMD